LRHITDGGTKPQTPTALLVASEKIGTEENEKKTKYTFMSFEQKAGKYSNIRTDYESFDSVAQYKF
jgi:hypothetical protein